MITTEIIPVADNQIISLELAKAHLRIEADYTDDDMLIGLQIKAAQKAAENYMQRAVGLRQLVITMDVFQNVVFEGSSNDLIEEVEYYEPDAVDLTVMAQELYKLRKSGLETFEIQFSELPEVDNIEGAVIITVSQGYTPEECPEDIQSAMLLMIGDMYERREDREQGNNPASVNLMRPYRKW